VSTSLSYIYEVSFQRSKQASEMVRSTNSLHADLYRFLAWRQNVKAPERIAAVRTELNQALHRQQKALEDFASLIAADDEQKELFASIQTKNNDYRKTIADVLDLAEMDSETAILYAVDAEVGIATLRKGIDGFFNSNEEALDRYFDDITASAKESLLILVVLTAVALVIAAIVTTIVSRVISGPLRDMTKTMMALADGDLTAQSPYDGRRDEIGEMASSLTVFRENAIRARDLEAARRREELAKRRASGADRAGHARLPDRHVERHAADAKLFERVGRDRQSNAWHRRGDGPRSRGGCQLHGEHVRQCPERGSGSAGIGSVDHRNRAPGRAFIRDGPKGRRRGRED
jgi:methyl-accepting chemotaxis protein